MTPETAALVATAIQVLRLLAIIVGVLVSLTAVAKAGWSIAQFFVGLSEQLKALTGSVQDLNQNMKALVASHAELDRRVTRLEAAREVA